MVLPFAHPIVDRISSLRGSQGADDRRISATALEFCLKVEEERAKAKM